MPQKKASVSTDSVPESESRILSAIMSMESKLTQHIERSEDRMCKQLELALAKQNSRIDTLAQSLESVVERVSKVETAVQSTSPYNPDTEKIHIELRKLNLIFVGFKETEGETETSLISTIIDFCAQVLEVGKAEIDSAFRIGLAPYSETSSRNIKVRFFSLRQRNAVFNARNKLREKRIYNTVYINEDLPPLTLRRRKVLRDECKKANAAGANTRLLGDKLWIENLAYVVDENEKLVQWKPPNSCSNPTLPQQRKRRLEKPASHVPASAVNKKPNTSHFNFSIDSGLGRTGSSSSASSGASASSASTSSSSSTQNSSS